MSDNYCDCDYKGNVLTDLEKMELIIFITGEVLQRLVGKDYLNLKDHLLSVPDLAVKFADAVAKSTEDGSTNWDEVSEIFGAAATLVGTLAELAQIATPWMRVANNLQEAYFLTNDLLDGDSPLRRAIDKLLNGDDVPLDLVGDNNANELLGSNFCDTIQGMGGDDYLYGGKGQDKLYGGENNDLLIGGECNDYLDGGNGEDNLGGGDGNDVLIGGLADNVRDNLEGDGGFDTYLAGSNDIVSDLDGKGVVYFKNIDLSGTKHKVKGKDYYEDDSFYYVDNGGVLVISSKSGESSMTIVDWSNKELGITLEDGIEVSITKEASALEGDSGKQNLYFTVTLSRALEDGESLKVSVSGTDEGYVIFESGEKSKRVTHSWDGDTRDEGSIDHTATLSLTGEYTGPYEGLGVVILNSGKAIVYDDDEEQRHDPLALDMDMDGFISTTALETSGTYFDITGDGLKERVGWISGADALLSYDKNDNGEIDGIDEVFGSLSESGFEELKRLADSNHDNKIDRQDELFYQLEVWNDLNQDAEVQSGELQSLSEAGITSIDLNYVSTNININGNLLVEASKYTDTEGDKELAADIQFATDAKDTRVDIEDIPNFTIDPITNSLPQLRGSGLVYDSFILYNLDPQFKALALKMSQDIYAGITEFDAFMEQYSGYTAYINQLREKYSQSTFEMVEADKRAWIVERFEATNQYITQIETYYNTQLNNGKIPTVSTIDNSIVSTIGAKYDLLLAKFESTFAIQSTLKDVFVGTSYSMELKAFVIEDTNIVQSKIVEYFNNKENSIEEKLYLAKIISAQQADLSFDMNAIIQNIDNNIIESLIYDIFTGEQVVLFGSEQKYNTQGIIVTGESDELITISDADSQIVLNSGNDILNSGKGNNTFYFRIGDGSDIISDKGGIDTLVFDKNITRDDIVIQLNRNSDLVIAIKEVGKSFDELSDKITIVDWIKSSNRVETIEFGDGNRLNFQDVFELFQATDGIDVIQLGSGNDIVDTKGGNDFIQAMGGNDILIGGEGSDRLEGGIGNDIYIYYRGDGKDTIVDSGDYDTLQFKDNIAMDDLVVQYNGNDLLIAIKEDSKTFDELNDVITIKNYKNAQNNIEAIYLEGYQRVSIDRLLNSPTEFDDNLTLSNNNQHISLLSGDDIVSTGEGNDIVSGNDGNDTIKTYGGNDTLSGNNGNDTLEGGLGDDTYVFNRGDGKDTIYDDYSYGYQNTQKDNAGNDTLTFGEGINADDIITKYFGQDLLIGIKEGDKPFEELSDIIKIKDYTNENNQIEHFILNDGSEININTPESSYENVATTGDDVLFFEESISIDTLQGHDFIHTGNGNDDVFGNRGNDDIHTGDGDDTLNGGTGIDYLLGGDGNDTYIFNRGDGNNTIFDDNRDGYVADTNMYHGMYTTYPKITGSATPQKDAGIDTLIFGEGITIDDIEVRISTESFSSSPRDIVIYIKENGSAIGDRAENGNIAGDTVTIRDYFDSRNKIENILLSDGTKIDIDSMINQVTNGDDCITYLSSNENMVVNALDGNDIVQISLGNDTLIGGKGNDQLQGGGGDDTYIFNLGDGKDTIYDYDAPRGGYFSSEGVIYAGNDTLQFGKGIKQEDLKFVFQGNDLIINIVNTEDSITIKNYDTANHAIEKIVFNDGTKVDLNEMALESLGENVVVPDQGSQENIYILNYADGVITIVNSNANDILQIAEGIDVEQLIAKFVGNDLVVALKESDVSFEVLKDKVVIKNYLLNKIENIVLNDGSKIKLNDILLQATEDNDILCSYEQEALVMDALAGNDTITTGNGNDTLIGGVGNDMLNGGAGNDTYLFNRGDGQDTIASSYGNDTFVFGAGITADEIEARFVGSNLVVAIKESGVAFEVLSDKITIQNNFITTIMLNDGTKLSLNDIWSRPTQGDDVLDYTYTQNAMTVDGLGGDDTITTSSGDDTLIGSGGNDTLNSGFGSDTLHGGVGNDTLNGGAGNDTYLFNRGDGKDVLSDNFGDDTIVFGNGISADDLRFVQDDFDLWIALNEDSKSFDELSDKIHISDWFRVNNNIETIRFNDGTTMSASEIASMFMSIESDTLYSNHGAEMFGGLGNDTYVYKKDDFTVVINEQFANKEIAVNAGNDTLKFEDITKAQVTIGVKGDDLILKIDADHETYTELKDYIVIHDWKNPNGGIEQIVFGDGEVLTIDKTVTYPALEFNENWIASRYYIYGSENNAIQGSEFSEVIESGAGNDTVMALGGNDYLTGGIGDDILNGGAGNDTYLFRIGDGKDVITDTSGLDTIKFGSGITRSDITITKVNNDLVMTLGTNDQLTLKEWFNEATIDNRVEVMVLDDEGEISISDFIITPTEGNDDLEYGDEKNRINALGGDDIIHIGGGNDILMGNGGDDRLYGEEGDDLIGGEQGNDLLYGGDGNDTYLFGRGDGNDTIIEDNFANWGQSGNDTIKFKEGISVADLILVQNGDDLIVAIKEDGKTFDELSDKITLKNWSLYDEVNSQDLSRAYYTIETFSFSDGTTWDMNDIISHIGSDTNESIIGFNQADTLEGQKGNDMLLGHLGNDTYIFNRGDGQDIIYDYGRKGENYSYYDAGNDTLKFGVGIGEADLIFGKDNNNVIIYIKKDGVEFDELNDKIILKDWFIANNRIENIVLSDGTPIDYIKYLSAEPTTGDDKLIYGSSDNYVDALEGDDIVVALGGNNIIDGNSGNDNIKTEDGTDILIGGEGNDILDGGVGDDTLEGGEGDDTYIFNRGDGFDTVNDDSGYETLIFGTDITQDDLVLFQDGNNLIIAINEDGVDIENLADKITIINWLNIETRLENITFSDGTMLDVEAIISMTGTDKDDTISGIELDDELYAGQGNDTLVGGKGDDYLEGDEGDDIYIFSRGDGNDTIYDAIGADSLRLGENVTIDDILIRQDGNDLIIALKEEGVIFDDLADKVTVENWLNVENRIETIILAGGEVLNANNMIEFIPSDEDDTILVPDELAVNMHLKRGNDSIVAGSHNDTLYGDDGDDELYAGKGNDTLIGGKGDDYLEGDEGDDIYIFNRGDGRDIINDVGGVDRLVFGTGIAIDDLDIQQNGNNLIVAIKEDGVAFEDLVDAITMINWTLQDSIIESIEFADGEIFTPESLYQYLMNDIITIIGTNDNDHLVGTDGEDKIIGDGGDDTILAGLGNDLVYGDGDYYIENIGNDIIYGGEGNDYIYGGSGNDFISGDNGADVLDGSHGSDTYFFKRGDGRDKITEWANQYEIDTIRFGEGITIDDINVESLNNDLIITINNSMYDMMIDDVITLVNGMHQPYVVEKIELNNGDIYDIVEYFNIELLQDYYPHPIVLDINGDGITSIALNESNAYFDYDGDGNREHTAWMQQGDAQLVVDINQDGKINDGSEIFGEFTRLPDGSLAKDGYEALAQYDTNGDRVIDSKDDAFGNLLLWQDNNQNGKTEEGELTNIQASGILALHLDTENGITFEQSSENGNIILTETNYVSMIDTGIMRDVGFACNPFDTITNNDTLSKEYYGDILSGEDGNDTYLINRDDGVIRINDNGDGNDTIRFGEGITAENLIVKWDQSNNGLIVGIKETGDITTSVVGLNDKIIIENWFDISGQIENFVFDDGSTLNTNSIYEQLLSIKDKQGITARVLEENGEIIGGSYRDVLYGTSGEESLSGQDGNDFLKGLGEDDLLNGGEGDDSLEGGLGDDTIYGGYGNDYYIFNRGDGRDLLFDIEGNQDTLMFGIGITVDDIIPVVQDDNLLIGLKEEGKSFDELSDIITIELQLIENFAIENIEFYDGLTISLNSILKPEINDIILTLQEDNSIDGVIDNTDASFTYNIVTMSQNGIFVINEKGEYTYTPNQDYNGSDSVTIKVTNEYGLTDTATLTLNVQAVNDAPVATDDTIQAVEDIPFISTVSLVANDSDIDGDNLSIVAGIFTTTQGGSIDIKADGSYTYTPSTNFNGVDTFEYTLTDGELTDTATLTLNIQAVNDAPVAQNAIATLDEDTILNGILPTASDVDGDSLTYTLDTDSYHGKVVINSNGSYSYTPNSNYYGTDSFVYLVSDGNGGQTTATINLTINPIIDDMTIYGSNKKDTLRGDQIDVGSNDTIYGLNGNDTIYGLGGNDIIDGGNGSDNVYGGDGNDIIYASLGRDYLDGGNGIDTISYANYTHGVVETLNSNTFISYILGNARNTSFENLEGSNYSDILTGDSQNNTIYGLNGNDTLNGGKGNDTLIGGNGKDILYGGAGNDIFVIDSLNKSDIDSILDFSSKDDTIYLDNSIFTSLINEGTLDSSNFVSNKSGNAIDSDDYIVYEIDTGKLFYDADGNGNGAAIQIATLYGLSNQNTLTYSDFTII